MGWTGRATAIFFFSSENYGAPARARKKRARHDSGIFPEVAVKTATAKGKDRKSVGQGARRRLETYCAQRVRAKWGEKHRGFSSTTTERTKNGKMFARGLAEA